MRRLKLTVHVMTSIFCMMVFSSCVNSKKLRYFTTVPENGVTETVKFPNPNIIRANDILQITVFSTDEETNRLLGGGGNGPVSSGSGSGSSGSTAVSGYLVNDSGFVKLPLLGTLKAAGIEKERFADTITQMLVAKKYLIDPIVVIRIINFRITVLGEVNAPGVITIPNEHVNITELIAMAGDLTIYGNRENILLIRELDGKRYYRRIDLNKIDLFNTDIYNLQNHDILYVEPTKAKAAAIDRTPQTLSLFISSLSIFIVIYTQLLQR
jgi:polysaccharide biosynthesis/export protein